ncbi:hypothetical protein J2X01_001153 [Arthrobacter ginsengisoli]|uniref:Uncharacterized protein n=1 Tax=Arthrobacter ginsengisoli TaxID=1356565 RepID=A0ABU1U9N9_9MICC|nr:hypothetical protein [Arthrobacter ginsengisoli]
MVAFPLPTAAAAPPERALLPAPAVRGRLSPSLRAGSGRKCPDHRAPAGGPDGRSPECNPKHPTAGQNSSRIAEDAPAASRWPRNTRGCRASGPPSGRSGCRHRIRPGRTQRITGRPCPGCLQPVQASRRAGRSRCPAWQSARSWLDRNHAPSRRRFPGVPPRSSGRRRKRRSPRCYPCCRCPRPRFRRPDGSVGRGRRGRRRACQRRSG